MRNRKKFLLIISIFIFIISISSTVSAKEITVDDGSGADFRSIQEAVNNSVPGDTIIVRPGTYTENVLVNITGLTIRSESKKSDVQVKPLDESESVFLIKADNVTISGFNITGANKDYDKDAIVVYSDMNKLTDNTIENDSILLGSERSGNLISGNKISNGGITIGCCGRNNVVSGNMISNCSLGISAFDTGVNFRNNRITDCHCGISLSFTGAGIYDNTILNCDIGINLGEGCPSVEIINNTIISSAECGIVDQYDEGGKRIYNNYFNNTLNVRLGAGGGNTWNSSLVSGTNIAGGPYIGGNFWAKPDGTGFSQICVDLDGNGIGDLPYKVYEDPYNVYEDEFDYLPLVSLSSLQSTVTPTANFTASATNGPAPLVVKFADLSKNAVLWNWDLDGDGISDSTKQNPVYAYKTAGNYTVNLTVSNGINTSSKLVNITVGKRVSATWPFVYITNNGAFSVIDTETGIVISSVKVGSGQGVAVSPDGQKAYVANLGSNNVSVIDTATNTVIATVNVGIDPSKVAVTQDGSKVYVVNYGSNNVSVIDTEINTVKATVPVGNTPRGIAVTPDGKKVYVANYGNNSVRGNTTSVIDTATNTVIATVPVGEHPWGVAVTPDGTKVYVTTYYYVSIIDTATNAVIATVDVTRRPQEVIVNPTGTKVYVTGGNSFVSVIDTATGKVLTTLNVGKYPEEIAVSPNGKKVYVVTKGSYENNYSNNISVIDTSNDTVSSIVNIEVSPGGIAIIPEPEPVFPVANFSSNVNEGFAPLAVKFNDSSENATKWNWDFGDGATSTEQNPTHTYFSAGTYNVNLIVSNVKGTSSKSAIIIVQSQSSSSGGNSRGSNHSNGGRGAGGAGGSPEPQSNVAAKEISQTFITSGSAVKFNFPQKATPVLYLGFDSKKTAGKTTTIVEMLKGKSTLATGLPSGEVCKYLNVWVGNGGFGDSNNIANAVINFKVEKSWIQDGNIDKSSITLNRYSDKKWNQLSTNLSGEDDKYLYFTAKTPGFSSFAITGKTTATGTAIQPATGNKTPSAVDDTQNNAGNETAKIDQTPERTQSSNNYGKEGAKTPDFEIASGIVCLLSVFLYKRR